MTVLIAISALAAWAVLSTIASLSRDGYRRQPTADISREILLRRS